MGGQGQIWAVEQHDDDDDDDDCNATAGGLSQPTLQKGIH
jgi:hypothetical protein